MGWSYGKVKREKYICVENESTALESTIWRRLNSKWNRALDFTGFTEELWKTRVQFLQNSLNRLCWRSEDLTPGRFQTILHNICRQGWAHSTYYVWIPSQQEIKYTEEFFYQLFLGQEYWIIQIVESNTQIYFHICLCSNSWGWLHVKGWCCNPQR